MSSAPFSLLPLRSTTQPQEQVALHMKQLPQLVPQHD